MDPMDDPRIARLVEDATTARTNAKALLADIGPLDVASGVARRRGLTRLANQLDKTIVELHEQVAAMEAYADRKVDEARELSRG